MITMFLAEISIDEGLELTSFRSALCPADMIHRVALRCLTYCFSQQGVLVGEVKVEAASSQARSFHDIAKADPVYTVLTKRSGRSTQNSVPSLFALGCNSSAHGGKLTGRI